jgi:hypothetical protein
LKSTLVIALTAILISSGSIGLVLYLDSISSSRLNSIENKLEEQSQIIITTGNYVNSTFDDIARSDEKQDSDLQLLRHDDNELRGNLTLALDRIAILENHVLPAKPDTVEESFPTLQEITGKYGDLVALHNMGISQVETFFKAGGNGRDGQIQSELAWEKAISLGGSLTEPEESGNNTASNNGLNTKFSISFKFFTDVKYDSTPDTFDCSDLRIHVYLDEKEVFLSSWMGYENRSPQLPLDTGIVHLHDISIGKHLLKFVPESRLSGCNIDYLRSWGGTIAILAH